MPAPVTTLAAIRSKFRKLTRTPNAAQISDAEIDEYINTFLLYDLPEHMRHFNLHQTFSFVTNAYQDTYYTDKAAVLNVATNPMYDFQNKYVSVQSPIYIAGNQAYYSQAREQFFGIYPKTNFIKSIGVVGNGVTTIFTGNIGTPLINTGNGGFVLLRNEVVFSSVDLNNNPLALIDVPVLNAATGNPTTKGNLYVPGTEPATPPTVLLVGNNIDYTTGAFTITFPTAPKANAQITSETCAQALALPQAVLFFDGAFILRPVPDQSYKVTMEVFVRPTFLATGQSPLLDEWWQLIAYGAAKKRFEDQMDLNSVQQILPEFMMQMDMMNRRTIVQYSTERSSTIFTEQTGVASGGWGWGSASNF